MKSTIKVTKASCLKLPVKKLEDCELLSFVQALPNRQAEDRGQEASPEEVLQAHKMYVSGFVVRDYSGMKRIMFTDLNGPVFTSVGSCEVAIIPHDWVTVNITAELP